MKKRILFIIIALALVTGLLSAQSSSGGRRRSSNFTMIVNSNVRGASVEVANTTGSKDGTFRGTTPFSQAMAAGTYNVTVTANGYETVSRRVELTADQTVNINLTPSTVSLRVTANVQNAQVRVIGPNSQNQAAAGNTTFNANLLRGNYRITVSANGYEPETQEVNLQRNQSLNFNLRPSTVTLRVTANVPNSSVQVLGPGSQNRAASGNVTFNANLMKGAYKVNVSADGYVSQTQDVNLQRNQTLNFNLTPAVGTVNLVIPAEFLDLRSGNPSDQVSVFIDGQPQSGNRTFQIRPGNHTIRVSSGAFNVQKNLTIQAGQIYDFEIYMELRATAGK